MEMTTAIILGYIGVALMVGLSGAASCIGTSIAGQASVGAMKKNGGAFGSYMILLNSYENINKADEDAGR
ncbi:V-type ATP synthase subunit K [human gut metagenome]|uniref:V-type ATP synthase subunit K n=1 Tax=human gut metagenome TaxID=408170 RepID=K1T7H4_9ZZZZ